MLALTARAVKILLLLLLLGAVGVSGLRAREITVVVDQPIFSPLPVRVPPLKGPSSEALNLTRVLRQDLDLHLIFKVLKEPPLPGVSSQGYLIAGQVEVLSSDLRVTLELRDLLEGRVLLRRRFVGPRAAGPFMIHRFVDEAVKAMAGFPGVSYSQIAFVRRTPKGDELRLMYFDRRGERVLYRAPIILSPRFSPDGRRLALVSYDKGRPRVLLLDLTTGRLSVVAAFPGLNASPVWTPDGKHLVVTLSKDGSPDLYLLDLKGRVLRRLTQDEGINTGGSFSPDGHYLAFVSDRSGSPQIYLYDFFTGGTRRLTFSGRYNVSPSWSPRGERLVFAGLRQGKFILFSMDPEGGEPLAISGGGSYEDPVVAPDGYYVLARGKGPQGRGLYLFLINGAVKKLYLRASDLVDFDWGRLP
ncbi:MAG TPA: hypothetical protein ENJ40_08725 [Thermosulfurimonas dismutans]|uniref:Tol-Pal system beta propeller repeat protein TolB n=1 Tax=Thermosulfurimonas dismutans TaxID=999894 RepID=A0A7C3GLH5_9BACT|nr:hypothetical protein [Thermosulfurimonas dismutans]